MKGARRFVTLLVLLVATGLALFAFDFPRLASDDMAPTLRRGDLLVACRLCTPGRGDVVVFTDEAGQLSLRRIVALPGEPVTIVAGRPSVGGSPLAQRAAGTVKLGGVDGGPPQQAFAVVEEDNGAHHYRVIHELSLIPGGRRGDVPAAADGYFVMADHRTLVRDSRDYGPVPRRRIRAVVLRVLSAGDDDSSRQTAVP